MGDALTGVAVFGATGSGKTSGAAKHLAIGYLAADFGGLVLCAKKEERRQWVEWAAATDRSEDLVIIDASGDWRFNFLDWEASRAGEGAGLTLNIVALLDEIAGAIAGGAGKAEGGGDNKFFEDALHHMNINLVDLPLFAGLPVSLPLLRSIVNTAPRSPAEALSEAWQQESVCAAMLREAKKVVSEQSTNNLEDYEECRQYWLQEFPALSEKTRSIITLSFSMLVRPFLTRPLRKLFSTDTNITPEDAFKGKIIIIDLPVQEFRLAGRVANLAWKYCFQVAVLRRMQPKGRYLRPVFLWADEAQNFITEFDAEYQAVARSAGGCTVYLTQNRESYRRVLGNNDAVDSLLGNLQAKFFCQNSGDTNEWAAKLFGEHWLKVKTTSFSSNAGSPDGKDSTSSSGGISTSEQRRFLVEPSLFTVLKRGGEIYDFQVEAIVYKGGHIFADGSPFKLLTFNQR
ncbi:MAG: TraM recognition domain-containing protein [Phycisphaerae bacterium]|nr:TraM recognition domain-containing protein [Phycisphaerae bacterium]